MSAPDFRRRAWIVAALILLAVVAWVLLGLFLPRGHPKPAARDPAATTPSSTRDFYRNLPVMTANINNLEPNAGAHSWSRRRGVLLAIFRKYHPDILALQAAPPAQSAWLAAHLTGYAHWPVNTGLPTNIFSALDQAVATWNQIFYTRRFTLLAGDYGLVRPHHLAKNPTENTYDSLAVLEDRFHIFPKIIVIDTHLRHGQKNAAASAVKLHTLLRHWRMRYPAARVILLGDMNHPWTDRAVYQALLDGSGRHRALVDTFAYHRKPHGQLWGTWQNYTGRPVAPWPTDLILLSPGWQFTPASILRDHGLGGLYPSDHFFVLTTLSIQKQSR